MMSQFLHDLVSNQAIARPENVAVIWKDERIPYGELDRLTYQLAQTLRAYDCQPGDRVCVLMPNSANALTAILGILKAGCVAVPIDLALPAEQLAAILSESRPSLILTARAARQVLDKLFADHILENQKLPSFPIGTLEALRIEGEHFTSAFCGIDVLQKPAEPLPCRMTLQSPALLFFSSGVLASEVCDSSVTPIFKATAFNSEKQYPTTISHAEILGVLDILDTTADLQELDRVAVLPLLLPLAVTVAFEALAAGAELHIVPQELLGVPQQIAVFVRRRELTHWLTNHGTLSELVRSHEILDGDFPALKRLIWTGSQLSEAMLLEVMQCLPLAKLSRFQYPVVAMLKPLVEEVTLMQPEVVPPLVAMWELAFVQNKKGRRELPPSATAPDPERLCDSWLQGCGIEPELVRDPQQ